MLSNDQEFNRGAGEQVQTLKKVFLPSTMIQIHFVGLLIDKIEDPLH